MELKQIELLNVGEKKLKIWSLVLIDMYGFSQELSIPPNTPIMNLSTGYTHNCEFNTNANLSCWEEVSETIKMSLLLVIL